MQATTFDDRRVRAVVVLGLWRPINLAQARLRFGAYAVGMGRPICNLITGFCLVGGLRDRAWPPGFPGAIDATVSRALCWAMVHFVPAIVSAV